MRLIRWLIVLNYVIDGICVCVRKEPPTKIEYLSCNILLLIFLIINAVY